MKTLSNSVIGVVISAWVFSVCVFNLVVLQLLSLEIWCCVYDENIYYSFFDIQIKNEHKFCYWYSSALNCPVSFIYCCFTWTGGGVGGGLKHCSKNAVYNTNATDIAIKAYMNILSSGWRKRFFRNHSRTSSSDSKSPGMNIHNWNCDIFIRKINLLMIGVFRNDNILNLFHSPRYMLGNRFRKYTIAGNFVTPHFRAYLESDIFTNVMSKLSVSLSIFSNFSRTIVLSGWSASSNIHT